MSSLKLRLEGQRLKLGAAAGAVAAAQEVAKKAREAGGGVEETKQAEQLVTDLESMQKMVDTMEGQRQSLESEAFGKAAAPKPARGSPF